MRFVADWQRERPAASLTDFVVYLDVYQQMGGDLDLEPADRGDVDGVQLMTVYQAKGLEYEVVLVPRLVQKQFPDERKSSIPIPVELLRQAPPDEYAVAEERRLLFVAMTRARQRLVLSAIDGHGARPSRFAAEIAPEGGGAGGAGGAARRLAAGTALRTPLAGAAPRPGAAPRASTMSRASPAGATAPTTSPSPSSRRARTTHRRPTTRTRRVGPRTSWQRPPRHPGAPAAAHAGPGGVRAPVRAPAPRR